MQPGLKQILTDPEVLELYTAQIADPNPPTLVQCAILVLLWRNGCLMHGQARMLAASAGLPL